MDPQLYRAAKLGDIQLLRQVVNGDSSRLLRVTPQGNTILHVSVSFGHIDLVEEVYAALLQHNSSLEGETDYKRCLSLLTQVNSVGDTVLHVAAREGHSSIAKFLIQKIMPWPSDDHDVESGNSSSLAREIIRMRNASQNTALQEAVRGNDVETVKLLIEVDPNDLGHPNYDADAEGRGQSPLYLLAAKNANLDVINQILEICPSAAHGGPHGRTALHVAAVEGAVGVVEVLLDHKTVELVNKIDAYGRTALHYAVSRSFLKIVQKLVRHDTSSVYQLDEDGLSPLHIAALESSIEVFREVIQCCPDSVELLDNKRRNVLHFSVMSKDFKKIRYALEQIELKKIINQADDDGNTPFHLVAKQSSLILMRCFISNTRVDVKATNNSGETASDIFLILPN